MHVRYAFTAADQGHADLSPHGNLRAVQLLLGQTKIESTVRYLGIEVDDALAIAEQPDVCWHAGRRRSPMSARESVDEKASCVDHH